MAMPSPRIPLQLLARTTLLIALMLVANLAILVGAPAHDLSGLAGSGPGSISVIQPGLAAPGARPTSPPPAHPVLSSTASQGNPVSGLPPPGASARRALQAASSDLASGRGPSGLAPLRCSVASGGSAPCQAPSPGIVPAAYAKPYGFQPTSPLTRAAPPAVVGGNLAWDAGRGVVLFFGGQDPTTGALLNQTWEYSSGQWFNLTNPLAAPPARSFGAMAYDAALGAIVLVGGCGIAVCPLDDTWENFYGAWTNLTTTAYPLTYGGPGLYDPAMAQNGTNGLVLFGGCWDTACATLNIDTFYFSANAVCAVPSDPCWWSYLVPGPAGRYDTSFVADQSTGYDLLYGGFSPAGGTGGTYGFNDTWEYDPATYTWTDLTPSLYGGAYPSQAIFGMTLFYDANTGVVFLYGGENATYSLLVNEFWAYNGGGWVSAVGLIQPPPWPITFASIATDPLGYSYPPVLFGGINQSLAASNQTWVFEPGLITTASALPLTVETNVTVNFFANVTGGSCDVVFYFGQCFGTWNFGNGVVTPGENVSATYTRAGSYVATLEGYDTYGVSNFSTVSITVTTFTVSESATPATVSEGTAVTFLATPTGGSPAYNYTWHLSDGTVRYGSGFVHSFFVPGTQWGNVTVTDATGTQVSRSASVHVVAPLTASITASPPAGVDVGHSVTFTAAASGGDPPFNFTWSVGGSTGYGATYLATPNTAGSLTATVTVKDFLNSSATKSIALSVNTPLGAAVTANPSSPSAGTVVTFGSGQSGGTPAYTYSWQFGDGTASTLAAPAHPYPNAGTFEVNLWVNDSGGGAVHATLSLTVAPLPSPVAGGSFAGLPTWLLLVLLGIVVVVAAATLLAMRRRRRPNGAPSSVPPPSAPPPHPEIPPPPPGAGGPPPGAT